MEATAKITLPTLNPFAILLRSGNSLTPTFPTRVNRPPRDLFSSCMSVLLFESRLLAVALIAGDPLQAGLGGSGVSPEEGLADHHLAAERKPVHGIAQEPEGLHC